MSSIIFEGNTYTFGATVSANPGTGTTSYVFGGLSSGWTYGFIIWAFNGFGSSSIVGPTIKSTISSLAEQREPFGALAWVWDPISAVYTSLRYDTGSEINMFYDSDTLGSEFWGFAGYTRTPYHELLPTGTTGWNVQSNHEYQFLQQYPTLESGNSYMISWYQHTSSTPGMRFQIYGVEQGGGDSVPKQQKLPQVGLANTGSISLLGPTGGQSGWIRYAVEVYITGPTRTFVTPFRTSGGGTYIIGAPQLEKMI